MTVLSWDNVGDRFYETGLDRGVLYLPDGSGVPWNGLTSVNEKFDKDTTPVYYDGIKISDLVVLGDYAATIKAFTYPVEFMNFDGYGFLRKGLYLGNQVPQSFSLSYRTKIGNDVQGNDLGYKIHIIYNATAIPNDTTYQTITDSLNLIEFEWDISAVPEEVPGFRPTAHIIVNTIDLEPELLDYIEGKLYGTDDDDPSLISITDLISYMYTWVRMEIVDNSNGTWTANSLFDTDITVDITDPTLFTITNAMVKTLDVDTYEISSTTNTSDVS